MAYSVVVFQSLSSVWLCVPMDCHTKGTCPFLPPIVWTNSCALSQWFHPLLPTSFAFSLSQNQGLFYGSSHQVAKVLELQLQHQSFQWIFRVDFPLGLTGLISLQSKGLLSVFSSTTIQKHQFFGIQPSLWSNSYICTLQQIKP